VNCRKANSLLSAYIDGELTGTEQLQVRQHLRVCNCCVEEHESLQQTKQILARLSARAPKPALEERILQRIADEAKRPVPRLDFRGRWGLLAEPDRAALRSFAVLGVVALAAMLYLRLPAGVGTPNPSQIAVQNHTILQPEFQPPIPVRNMWAIHNVGGAAQPVSTGVMPVSDSSQSGAP
jgi:anti-sigma factor RsiW